MNMKGQTLLEVLIALSVAVIIISAVASVSISSLNNAQYARDHDQAAKYAQEGIEMVRKIRNNDYAGFKTYSGLYCLGSDGNLGNSASSCNDINIDNKFIRSVRVVQGTCENNPDVNIAEVAVEVVHSSGKCKSGTFCHSSKLVSCFSTINPVPLP